MSLLGLGRELARPAHRAPLHGLVALLVAGTAGAQLFVPGDHPTLQAAVAAAPPGATIVVQTPALQAPVVVDKALTIIGDPVANIGTDGMCGSATPPSVQLAGPGSGTVVLVRVDLQQCFDDPFMPPLLDGGGFSELYVYDSTLVTSNTGLTGAGFGSAAVTLSLSFALFSGTTVVGGEDDIDICTSGGFPGVLTPYLAYPAIDAPGSTIVALDSTIRGGSNGFGYCCEFCVCPPDLSTVASPGGPGIVAARVLVSGGSVAGGIGASIFADFALCGSTPDGPAFVASGVDFLPGLLTGSGQFQLGAPWTLSYLMPGPGAALLFDLGLTAPVDVPGFGWFFLGSSFLVLGPVTVGVPDSLTFPPVSDPVLLGLSLTFQIFDTSLGLTRPVSGVVVP